MVYNGPSYDRPQEPPDRDPGPREYSCEGCGTNEEPVTEETWRGPPGGEWKVIIIKCPECGHIISEEDG